MKYLTLIFLIFLLPIATKAQLKETIREQAFVVAKATMDGDYETIVNKTYTSLVEMAGGKDKMIRIIKEAMEQLKSQNTTIDTVIIGFPQDGIYKAGNELHTLIPEALVMSTPKGRVIAKSFIIAISKDDGLTWSFLQLGESINNETIKRYLPNFNENLKLPEEQKPILYTH